MRVPLEVHGLLFAGPFLIGGGEQSASRGQGMLNGSAKKEESLDDRIESVLVTLEGKVASPPAQWQVEWERRQAGRYKSPASTRR